MSGTFSNPETFCTQERQQKKIDRYRETGMDIYIYIYIERERDRKKERNRQRQRDK